MSIQIRWRGSKVEKLHDIGLVNAQVQMAQAALEDAIAKAGLVNLPDGIVAELRAANTSLRSAAKNMTTITELRVGELFDQIKSLGGRAV